MAKKTNSAAPTAALTKYDERLAALAKQATEVEASVGSAGNFLSIRGAVLSYQGVQATDNKMSVIILHAILENQWYNKPFNPASPTSPACYAFGDMQKTMVPHEMAPQPQSETCASCEKMQFGSAEVGKGKACKAVQRLALITEGDLENLDENAQIAYLKLPFYSTIEYASYVRQLAEQYKKPPLAFVTEITVVPDPKSQYRVKFKLTDKIEDSSALELLLGLHEKAKAEIAFPYPEMDEAPDKPAPAPRHATQPKPAVRKPAAAQAAVASAEGTPVKVGLRRGVKPAKF